LRRLVALAAVTAFFILAGCGDDDDSEPLAGGAPAGQDDPHAGHRGGGGAANCSPSDTTLSVTAKDIEFDKSCLAAPAGQAFTLEVENKDSVAHNVAILQSHESTDSLFTGDLVTGPDKSVTYDVPALPAGTYHFHCIVHPDQMKGTFVVE
jgi:plastocyanin